MCLYPQIVNTNTYLIKDSYQILLYLSNWFIHIHVCMIINNSENGDRLCKQEIFIHTCTVYT